MKLCRATEGNDGSYGRKGVGLGPRWAEKQRDAPAADGSWTGHGPRKLWAATGSVAVAEQAEHLLHRDGRSQRRVINAGRVPRHAGVYWSEGFGLAWMRQAR
jgi:hypothetical protein